MASCALTSTAATTKEQVSYESTKTDSEHDPAVVRHEQEPVSHDQRLLKSAPSVREAESKWYNMHLHDKKRIEYLQSIERRQYHPSPLLLPTAWKREE